MSTGDNKFSIPIKYLLLPLLVAIVVYVAYLVWYVGAFKPVVIEEKKAGPFTYLAKDHVGAYHKIVPAIEEVETWAKEKGLDCKLTFGKYLNDPGQAEESRLKSYGGCLLSEAEASSLKAAGTMPEGFRIETEAAREYVTALFEGSPGIGPMKVYPKVMEYFHTQNLSREEWTLEVYEVHSQEAMTTTYYFPKR